MGLEVHGRALVAGHLTLDLVPDLTGLSADQLAGPSDARVGGMHVSIGGAIGNVATALSALGVPTEVSAAAGAWAVELFDTAANLPSWEELSERIEVGWKLLEPGIDLDGWLETPTLGVWAPAEEASSG